MNVNQVVKSAFPDIKQRWGELLRNHATINESLINQRLSCHGDTITLTGKQGKVNDYKVNDNNVGTQVNVKHRRRLIKKTFKINGNKYVRIGTERNQIKHIKFSSDVTEIISDNIEEARDIVVNEIRKHFKNI